MFELHDTQALIRSINPRAENHGDETALAVDIGLEYTLSNTKLELLQPGLLALLYKKDPDAEGEQQESLEIEPGMLPHRRYPLLGVLPWDYQGVGYTFEIVEDGLFDTDSVRLTGCKLNTFKIECEEGGTIKLRCRVQAQADGEIIGELANYIKHDIVVSLIAPSRGDSPQADIEDEQEQAAA